MNSHASSAVTWRGKIVKAVFKIVGINELKSHEELQEKLLKGLLEMIKRDGFIRKPIVVEDKHYVILDGHHRWGALRLLGCKKIPIYLVDYFDDGIIVETWPGAVHDVVTKEEVIEMGLSDKLFPAKTTRHRFKDRLKEVKVDLKELY